MKRRMPAEVAETVIERSGGLCEAMNFQVCTGRAEHLHHRKISGREHAVANVLHVCAACHRWFHANPARSYELGWLVKMAGDFGVVPVVYRHRLVRLLPNGELEEVNPDGDD